MYTNKLAAFVLKRHVVGSGVGSFGTGVQAIALWAQNECRE